MKKVNKIKGINWEKKVERCINSGALFFDKGDLKTSDFIIECKTTEKNSYRVSLKILEKLWNDSLDSNKLPKLVIGIKRNEREIFMLSCDLTVERK